MNNEKQKQRPVGIFDSGIGGLTVLKEVAGYLPHEDIIYLGDTARVPYGIRSQKTVIRYSFQNTEFLIKQGVKALIVACNTASSVSIDRLKEQFAIPVIGVIEPGVKAAISVSENRRIGVIGTEATINSGAYQKILLSLLAEADISAVPCPLFVPLVEEGWTKGDIAKAIVKEYLQSLKKRKIDTLVLGCTHYPLLKALIGVYMGREVILIDSAEEVAKETKHLLKENGLMREDKRQGKRTFFVTDSPERFQHVGESFIGEKIDDITLIDIV